MSGLKQCTYYVVYVGLYDCADSVDDNYSVSCYNYCSVPKRNWRKFYCSHCHCISHCSRFDWSGNAHVLSLQKTSDSLWSVDFFATGN